MKVKILVATLFASFALVVHGNTETDTSQVEQANSLGRPATTGYAGAGSPDKPQPKEAEANEASSNEVVEKMSGEDAGEDLPGAVERAMGGESPLSAIPRDDLPKECLDYFQELEERLHRFPEAREAAMKAAEELRASFESMEGDLEQFAQTCQDRYEDFKKANAQLDERIEKEGAPE